MRPGDMNQDDPHDDMTPHQRDVMSAMWGAEDRQTGDPLIPVFLAAIIGAGVVIAITAIIIF